jgi:predicted TIM-barrel fold metal-dependent hydrolase
VIVDVHTHVWDVEAHIAQEVIDDQAKQAQRQGHGMSPDMSAPPERHWPAMDTVDRAVVFGLRGSATGFAVPNEYVAAYVAEHSDKLVGFCSIDPGEGDPVAELERSVNELGLVGVKISPVYAGFDPCDQKLGRFYKCAEMMRTPLLWHQGGTIVRRGHLEHSSPLELDPIAREFPQLTMVVAHMGKPWFSETAVLVRKHSRVYADISSVLYSPWQFYQAVLQFYEWGIADKLLFGSDFPWMTPAGQRTALEQINDVVAEAKLPTIPVEVIDRIVHNNAAAALPEILN